MPRPTTAARSAPTRRDAGRQAAAALGRAGPPLPGGDRALAPGRGARRARRPRGAPSPGGGRRSRTRSGWAPRGSPASWRASRPARACASDDGRRAQRGRARRGRGPVRPHAARAPGAGAGGRGRDEPRDRATSSTWRRRPPASTCRGSWRSSTSAPAPRRPASRTGWASTLSCNSRSAGGRLPTGGRATRHGLDAEHRVELDSLEHPVAARAAEREPLVAVAGSAKTALSSSVPGRSMIWTSVSSLGSAPSRSRRVGGARGGLEPLARPAAILRVGGGEVLVDLREVRVEAAAGALELAPARVGAADGEDDDEQRRRRPGRWRARSACAGITAARRASAGAPRPCA